MPELARPHRRRGRGLGGPARGRAARPRGAGRPRRRLRAARPAGPRAPVRRPLTVQPPVEPRRHRGPAAAQHRRRAPRAAPARPVHPGRAGQAHRPGQGHGRRHRRRPRGGRRGRRGGLPAGRPRPARAGPVALRGERFVALGLELNVDYVVRRACSTSPAQVVSSAEPLRAARATTSATWPRGRARRARRARRHAGRRDASPCPAWCAATTAPWRGHPTSHVAGTELADALGSPGARTGDVDVSNDANCAAYAESHHGAARGAAHALYLTGTVGIGAGIVQDGELVRGGAGFAGEVGHMPVGRLRRPLRLRTPRLLGGLDRAARDAGRGRACPSSTRPLRTAEAVADARRAPTPRVRAGLERVGRDVGLGIAMLSSVLDPEVVVLGGYFAPARRPGARARPAARSTSGSPRPCRCAPSCGSARSASRPRRSAPPSSPSARSSPGDLDLTA